MLIIDDEEEMKDYGLIEDKDKVLVDAIDVSKCKYFWNKEEAKDLRLCKINFDNNYFSNGVPLAEKCNKHINCYFKQLQRLKAENEQLKNDIETGVMCVSCTKELLNCNLHKENEELKAEIKRLEAPSMIIPNLNQTGVPIEEYLKLKTALKEIWVMATIDVSFASFCKIQTKIAEVLNNVDSK